MNNALYNSLIWRIVLWIGVQWKYSRFRQLCLKIQHAAHQSTTKRIGVRFLGCPTDTTDRSRLAAFFKRMNLRLWQWGEYLLRALHTSLLYRIYCAIFRVGRESKILGGLFRGGMTSFILFAVGIYTVIDFVLRDMLAIPVISSVWDEALLMLAVLWVIYDLMRVPRALVSRFNPLDTPVFLFVGIGLALMFIVSPYFSIAVSGYRATVQYMLWFFVLTRLIRDDKDFIMLYMVLVMVAFLISLHGIYQYIVAAPIPSSWTDQAEQSVRTRVYSIFGSPNIMADFMVMFAPMTAGLAYFFKDKRAKLFFWFATFCMCFSCLFTMSRGGWMAMALAILVFAILVDRRLLGLICIAGVAAMFMPFVASRIGYLFTPEFANSTNNGGRGSRWALALSYLAESPIFGFGLGMFGGAVAMQNKVYPWVSYFYVDNYYLKILVEMGYIGFIVFILLLISLLVVGLRAVYRVSREPKSGSVYPLSAGMFAGLCGVLVHCYFENIFEEPYMMAYFWSIAAMLVYLGFLRKRKRHQT